MTTTDQPRDGPEVAPTDAPGAEFDHPAVREAVAQMERTAAKSARDRAKRKPLTAEQRERYNRRKRLKTCAAKIEQLAAEVEQRHTDRSGGHWLTWSMTAPPTDDSDLRSRDPRRSALLNYWERIEREAAEGCEESAAFVVEWGPVLALALHLRHQRPPQRAADYDPREVFTDDQRAWLAQRMR